MQLEQSGGVGSEPGRVPPLERHDMGSWPLNKISYQMEDFFIVPRGKHVQNLVQFIAARKKLEIIREFVHDFGTFLKVSRNDFLE